ncbi:hypothetical protein TL16_g11423, partial [Triparma laevis f. inornata]
MNLPIISAKAGTSLEARVAEVNEWGAALTSPSKTIVINGAGSIGLEVAADVRLANPSAKILVLSRSGNVLTSFAYPPSTIASVLKELKRLNIEIVKATVCQDSLAPSSTPKTIKVVGGNNIEADVFLPAYQQGCNTSFFNSSFLDDTFIKTNSNLQSVNAKEVFAIGVNTLGIGFAAMELGPQSAHCAANVKKFLAGQPLKPYVVAKQGAMGLKPAMLKLGYGKGGWMKIDNMPQPVQCCSFLCGWPCCPCFALCGGLTCCGTPCAPAQGQSAMDGFMGMFGVAGIDAFPGNSNMSGFGSVAPEGQGGMVR